MCPPPIVTELLNCSLPCPLSPSPPMAARATACFQFPSLRKWGDTPHPCLSPTSGTPLFSRPYILGHNPQAMVSSSSSSPTKPSLGGLVGDGNGGWGGGEKGCSAAVGPEEFPAEQCPRGVQGGTRSICRGSGHKWLTRREAISKGVGGGKGTKDSVSGAPLHLPGEAVWQAPHTM